MNDYPALLFMRNGVGAAPADLHQKLAMKFLQLNLDANTLPAKILFYTDVVKMWARVFILLGVRHVWACVIL